MKAARVLASVLSAALLWSMAGPALAVASQTSVGRPAQVSYIPIASGAQAELHVRLTMGKGVGGQGLAVVMCSDGSEDQYNAYLPANTDYVQLALIQSVLTFAMMAEKSVTIVSQWNGKYCQIYNVWLKG